MMLQWALPLCAVLLIAVQVPFSETRPSTLQELQDLIDAIDAIFDSNDSSSNTSNQLGNGTVCQTESCKNAATGILRNMNKSVDPCENFFEYTCGNWKTYNPISSTESSSSQFAKIQDSTDDRVREILEEDILITDISPVIAAKKLYVSCMSLDAIEKIGITPISMLLERNGGWPLIKDSNKWNANRRTWQEIVKSYALITSDYFIFSIGLQGDNKNSSIVRLSVDQPTLSIGFMLAQPEQYKEQLDTYLNYITNVTMVFARHSSSTVSKEKIISDVRDMINFEIEIAKILTNDETRRDVQRSYNPLTIQELQAFYNKAKPNTDIEINWLSIIQNLFDGIPIKIKSTETIILLEKDYIAKLVGVLNKTSARTLVNYVHWRFVDKLVELSTEELREYHFKLEQELYGYQEQTPRWKTCVSKNQLSDAISYQYVKKYFSKESKAVATKMVTGIVNGTREQILQSTWLDDETKSAAVNKLNELTLLIGYPEWYNNKHEVINYYKELVPKIGSMYLTNTLNVMIDNRKRNMKQYSKPLDKNSWSEPPITVNAWYEPSVNSLTIPVGILQSPFFDGSQLSVLNNGAIGAIIGHEISHGFDDVGHLFDGQGNVAQWWSNATLKSYDKKAQCFVDQFNKYQINGTNMTIYDNGALTEGENIADSTGLQTICSLYEDGVVEDDDQKLPGLEDFTTEQLLFLAYGNVWCSVQRPEFILYVANIDVHSPANIRVQGTVSNTNLFSKAFNCPVNSPMNPNNKCNIWK